jgi:4-amino-4-deoxy-L-arabinose transferase-like glycosyltransferase
MSGTELSTKLRAWMRGDGAESRVTVRMFWVGFAVRVAYMTLAHTYRIRLFQDHFQFGWEMGRIARALATGRGYADPFNGHSGPTAWNPPLYPLLIAGAFRLFGVYTAWAAWFLYVANSVFSAATAPAVYEIAWRSFGGEGGRAGEGRRIALWSGWLWALYPAAMQYAVHWIWDMALTAFLFSWVLVLALRIRGVGEAEGSGAGGAGVGEAYAVGDSEIGRGHTGRWVVWGLLWGLIALCNSALLPFLPFCGVWMVWGARGARLTAGVRGAVLAGVCCVAVVSPWVVRNWVVFHAFVPMRSNFGAELYEATLPSNNGLPWGGTLPLAEADPVFRRYERMGEIAFCKAQGARGWAALRARPGLYAEYTLRRVYFFWIGVPHTDTTGLVEGVRIFDYSVLSIAGLLGLGLALRRGVPGAWLYFGAFAIVPVTYYFITVQARFRHPLEPLICVLSVYLLRSADRTRVWSGLAVSGWKAGHEDAGPKNASVVG